MFLFSYFTLNTMQRSYLLAINVNLPNIHTEACGKKKLILKENFRWHVFLHLNSLYFGENWKRVTIEVHSNYFPTNQSG